MRATQRTATLAAVPEVLEIESYRVLAERVVGARIESGDADAYLAKKLTSPRAWSRAVKGLTITGTARRGKLLLLETDGPTLGLRFGMTGVLVVESVTGIDALFYGPHEFRPQWIRGGLSFADGRRLLVHDPRRLARVEIEPDLDELGPDVLGLTRRQFDGALHSRGDGPPLKARLLDQTRIAGIGNLLADEICFRAGVDPRTSVALLSEAQRSSLYRALTSTMRTLGRRGGSHTGDHMEARFPGGLCPKDGAAMAVATVGGRTTYWCSLHQT